MIADRGRFNVAAHDRHVSINVLATYDPGAEIADVEAAIKQAAREAVLRARAEFAVSPRRSAEKLGLVGTGE